MLWIKKNLNALKIFENKILPEYLTLGDGNKWSGMMYSLKNDRKQESE